MPNVRPDFQYVFQHWKCSLRAFIFQVYLVSCLIFVSCSIVITPWVCGAGGRGAGRANWLLCCLLVCNVCVVRCSAITLPVDVICRLCSVTVTFHGQLRYY